ncbi:FixH family protein [Virgibacillus halophilus]|uniref:FixH family protein n=1 Tax=Tigheibacillus halophilus TaxID=361280 RepID=A0ABU5C2D3_9BACI|nr:FixH family protein [Virgibacillus halophilus]
MKKNGLFVMHTLFVLMLLSACGASNSEKANGEIDQLDVLKASLHVPDHADKGEKIKLKTNVTYGDEKVTDADEVKYEVWVDGDKEKTSHMIEAKNNKDGSYSIETTFDKDAVYSVQVHVDAKTQHTMPMQQITIGKVKEKKKHTAANNHHHEKMDSGQGNGVSIHFMAPDKPKAGKDANLMVHINLNKQPLQDAKVRLEIWKGKSSNHEFIDAEQKKRRLYSKACFYQQRNIPCKNSHTTW